MTQEFYHMYHRGQEGQVIPIQARSMVSRKPGNHQATFRTSKCADWPERWDSTWLKRNSYGPVHRNCLLRSCVIRKRLLIKSAVFSTCRTLTKASLHLRPMPKTGGKHLIDIQRFPDFKVQNFAL